MARKFKFRVGKLSKSMQLTRKNDKRKKKEIKEPTE